MENLRHFDQLLGGQGLLRPVRALGYSRGALVMKQMVISGKPVSIEHGVSVAAANHVGFFTTLRRLGWLLTALRHLSPPGQVLRILSVLAQHSDTALSTLDGLRVMDNKSPLNQQILQHERIPATLISISGEFRKSLTKSRWERYASLTLHALLSAALSSGKHDWVIARDEQLRVDPMTKAGKSISIYSRHTRMIGGKLSEQDLRKALLWGE